MSMSSGLSTSSKTSLTLTSEQEDAVTFLYENDSSILIAPTGCGKTAVALHAMNEFFEYTTATGFIIAAPASVIHNWPKEAKKWGLTFPIYVLDGPPKTRQAILEGVDWLQPFVLVVSLNNLTWLLAQNHNCEGIIIDELSKATGKQTAKLKNKPQDRLEIRIGMTATPVAESFENLYAMCRIIDKGATFGRSKERYMTKYFFPTDYKGYNWELRHGADKEIMGKIKDMVHVIPYNKEDHMEPVMYETIHVKMSDMARKAYDTMRRDMLLEAEDIVAPNAAVMSSKLRQIASGFIIGEEGEIHEFDFGRDWYAEQWAHNLFNIEHKKGIILYEYDHQRKQLEHIFLDSAVYLYGGQDKESIIGEFKTNPEVSFLVAQYQTMSHGVDGLQHVCSDLLFYQPIWSRDSTEQAEGRIHRQGQKNQVTITTIVCEDSIDEVVMERVEGKGTHMKAFMTHLKGE